MATSGRSASASILFWLGALLAILAVIALATGTLAIPGLGFPPVELAAVEPWLLVLVILLGTKLLLEILKPVFREGLRARVPSEADIFSLFQVFSYTAWVGALVFAMYVLLGGNLGQIGVLGGAVVVAVLLYVLQEPLLNGVGWAVLVTRRVYKLGDRIEVSGTKGYVVSISPMNTTLREFGGWLSGESFTGRYATIPNKSILITSVFNYTKDTPYIWNEVHVSVTYESDLHAAERHIIDAAEEVVGDFMRDNRAAVREKYEFRDLTAYVIDEPTVRWYLRDSWVDLRLIFFCPAYRKGYYESEIVKRILDKFADDPRVMIAYPHVVSVPFSRNAPPATVSPP
ncbi:MAG TPA: mechanosensitive ion channel domain-containing protein [Thermoplasmata archaeon]|nr:mechanosensitive ion channel domain-containing protein [Thermoplasmata archaeon]